MKKEILELLKKQKLLKKKKYFIADTEKIIGESVKNRHKIRVFLYSSEKEELLEKHPALKKCAEKVKQSFMKKYSSVKTENKFLALVEINEKKIDFEKKDRIVLLDTIQDPGNLGAIIRSGAAFGFTSFFLKNCAWAYSEKTIRASAGAVLFSDIAEADDNAAECLKKTHRFYLTDVKNGREPDKIDRSGKFVLVFGNEGRGISKEITGLGDEKIRIDYPEKKVESLNVAATAAIIFHQMSSKL